MCKEKEQYLAPELTTVSFMVERGFQGSAVQLSNIIALSALASDGPGYQDLEDRGNAGSWSW